MTPRRWGLLALACSLLGLALGQEWLSIHFQIRENHLLDFFVGISAATAGIVALDRRPGNRVGWLLVAVSVTWFAQPYLLLQSAYLTIERIGGILTVVEVLAFAVAILLLWQIRSVLLILVPLVFLYGLLTDRTAKTAIGDLVLRLEGDIPTGQLGPILAGTLGDPGLRIAYAAASGDGWVDATGQPVTDPAAAADRHHEVTLIERDRRPYAALVHDRSLSQTLVTGVASAAALAIENEWLHAELRMQLDEVRASRARIVAAGDAERRRVERDLHDGAQQRLLALALALRIARRQIEARGPAAGEALDRAEGELKLAIGELRELARGIHPAILTDDGLAAAVRALALRATLPVPVTLDVPDRLPATIEATAYFAISEALANVSKHADATRATVDARVSGDTLRVVVADDGGGGADPGRGSGLRGLRDRVAAVAGELDVVSPAGAGTTVTITLPVRVRSLS
ncbi:MAG TPA: histidine kinase [Microlunatus sp.]